MYGKTAVPKVKPGRTGQDERGERSQSWCGDERGTALRASVSLPGEMEYKISTAQRTCVLHRVSMSWPLGWLRSGFSPRICERRSPIRQREGRFLKIVSELKQRHNTHIQAHLQSASKINRVRNAPKVAFHHALHSQRNKKRSRQGRIPFEISIRQKRTNE